MGFFDNVKSSLTETSQDLTQKAKDTTEIFRLGNVNKAKEKEIEKVVYQIGLKFYSEQQDECMEKFPELTTQIKTLQEEIAVNKEMIEKLSVEEVCTNCGKKLNPGSKFCIYCGTPVEKEKKEVKRCGTSDCVLTEGRNHGKDICTDSCRTGNFTAGICKRNAGR